MISLKRRRATSLVIKKRLRMLHPDDYRVKVFAKKPHLLAKRSLGCKKSGCHICRKRDKDSTEADLLDEQT